jgi:hypothetical protein
MNCLLIFLNLFFLCTNNFTIYAEVEKSQIINLPYDYLDLKLRDLSIYQKYYPGMIDVKRIDNKRTSWTYEIDMPLSKNYKTTYILEERSPQKGVLIYETLNNSNDYMFCQASLTQIDINKTELKIKMIIKTVREKGSDIHFLAPLLGQNFISKKMQDKLEEDMNIFFEKVINEFYTEYNNSK